MLIELEYKIDISVNDMYWTTGKGKYLKKIPLQLRAKIIKDVRAIKNDLPVDTTLDMEIWASEDWLCKDGSAKKKDLDNRLKFLIDSVFKGLEMDDKYVFDIHAHKQQSEKLEGTVIMIKPRHDKEVW